MLHIYNTRGLEYALELGAPVDCLVVDACSIVADSATTTDNSNNGVDGGGTNNNDTGGGVPNDVLVGQYPYYPDITSGKCYNDGQQSEFQVHLYDTLSDCVSFYYYSFPFFLFVLIVFLSCM